MFVLIYSPRLLIIITVILWQLIKSINPIGRESGIIIPDNNLLLKWLFFVPNFLLKRKKYLRLLFAEKRSRNIIYGGKIWTLWKV